MNQEAEQTLKDILISAFSFEVFTASYSNKYLARWATEQAIQKVTRYSGSCVDEGWFNQLESSALAYEQNLSDNNSEKLTDCCWKRIGSLFPSGVECRSNCEANPADAKLSSAHNRTMDFW